MLRILLTGGNGFIGRNLQEAWRGRYDVTAPSTGELDLLDATAIREFLSSERFDIVVHSATWNATVTSTRDLAKVFENNCRMFFNLERMRGSYGRLISYGSGAEYDRLNMTPSVSEECFDANVPTDGYGHSKYLIAKAIERTDRFYNLRLFGVFGKHEDWRIRFISHACCRAIWDLPITIRQNVFFDYLAVSDLARLTEWFFESDPRYKTYNVCTGSRVDLLTLARIVIEVSGKQLAIQVGQPGLAREYTGCNSRLLAEVPGCSFAPLRGAIEQLYHWYEEAKESIAPSLL
ncbi:MAG TPA: NAD(P)-dependent oxidoreductase [Bryobacteraceae bacterium]|nr:NAD(P)-dependent oxidoreductase [Bryobacteraceae bacterium]